MSQRTKTSDDKQVETTQIINDPSDGTSGRASIQSSTSERKHPMSVLIACQNEYNLFDEHSNNNNMGAMTRCIIDDILGSLSSTLISTTVDDSIAKKKYNVETIDNPPDRTRKQTYKEIYPKNIQPPTKI